jgi:hypothetical protein
MSANTVLLIIYIKIEGIFKVKSESSKNKRRTNTEGVSEQEGGEKMWANDRKRQLIYGLMTGTDS